MSDMTPKETFLAAYEREHEITMKVLRAYPRDRLDLRPHPKCKTARELAWVFAMERKLGTMVFNDRFPQDMSGEMPPPPDDFDTLLDAADEAHGAFGDLIRDTPDDELEREVTFMTGPQTMGKIGRLDWLWFLLHDEIHHRGQFSIYLRMADAKVPSIYGPTADEPWM